MSLLLGIDKHEFDARQAGEVLQVVGERLSLSAALVDRRREAAQRYFS